MQTEENQEHQEGTGDNVYYVWKWTSIQSCMGDENWKRYYVHHFYVVMLLSYYKRTFQTNFLKTLFNLLLADACIDLCTIFQYTCKFPGCTEQERTYLDTSDMSMSDKKPS